jgi:acyl-ACP thioesterase
LRSPSSAAASDRIFSASAAGGAYARVAAPSASAAPQLSQKRAPARFSCPHAEQVTLQIIPRRFRYSTRVGLADTRPDGRARFDAIARWLQDAAHADLTDSAISTTSAWVVRRIALTVNRFPRFEEPLDIVTWASGTGRLWAERSTTINDDISAVALWVHLDGGRPAPLPEGFDRIYGPSTEGRKVKARLTHPEPPADAARSAWTFRRADLDVADHVNNAAYWTVLEELVRDRPEPASAEIEFRAPAVAGEAMVLADGNRWWIAGPAGEIHASLTLSA